MTFAVNNYYGINTPMNYVTVNNFIDYGQLNYSANMTTIFPNTAVFPATQGFPNTNMMYPYLFVPKATAYPTSPVIPKPVQTTKTTVLPEIKKPDSPIQDKIDAYETENEGKTPLPISISKDTASAGYKNTVVAINKVTGEAQILWTDATNAAAKDVKDVEFNVYNKDDLEIKIIPNGGSNQAIIDAADNELFIQDGKLYTLDEDGTSVLVEEKLYGDTSPDGRDHINNTTLNDSQTALCFEDKDGGGDGDFDDLVLSLNYDSALATLFYSEEMKKRELETNYGDANGAGDGAGDAGGLGGDAGASDGDAGGVGDGSGVC